MFSGFGRGAGPETRMDSRFDYKNFTQICLPGSNPGQTAQYEQVGNAVPPLLARAIAKVVFDLVEQSEQLSCSTAMKNAVKLEGELAQSGLK